jgi:hypothetical protein
MCIGIQRGGDESRSPGNGIQTTGTQRPLAIYAQYGYNKYLYKLM